MWLDVKWSRAREGEGGEARRVINHEKSYNRRGKNNAEAEKSVLVSFWTMALAGGNQR